MKENYILSVLGKQSANGETDQIEIQTSASYVQKNGSRYITYKKYESNDLEHAYRTTIKIDKNNVVTLINGGEENYCLMLEKGKRHKSEYKTPFGSMFLGVYTHKIRNNLDDNGGELEVQYSIDFDSRLASTNELKLMLKESKKNVNSNSDGK